MHGDVLLHTIAQYSDLHFGGAGNGPSAPIPPYLARSALFDGLLGHGREAVLELYGFHQDLMRRRPAAQVVISGDVTANGAQAQFDLADSFLGGGRTNPFNRSLGLADWPAASVPGNHDKWPGRNFPIGWSTPGLATHLPGPYPRVTLPAPLRDGVTIRFIYVDSDADVGPFSRDRWLARGRFVSQIEELDQMREDGRLPARTEREIRVMVVHHAIAQSAHPPSNAAIAFPAPVAAAPRRRLEIDGGSLVVLQRALVEHGVRIVMTGHLHAPRLTEMTVTDNRVRSSVLESRCGTTTQLDRYPTAVLARMSQFRSLPPNTLVVHEVVARGAEVVWRSKVLWRLSGRGFVDLPHVSPDLPDAASLVRELAVLP